MAGDVVTATCGAAIRRKATPHRRRRLGVAEWTSHARARNGAPYDNDYALVFHVADRRIDAVSEYCDASYMKRILLDQLPWQNAR